MMKRFRSHHKELELSEIGMESCKDACFTLYIVNAQVVTMIMSGRVGSFRVWSCSRPGSVKLC